MNSREEGRKLLFLSLLLIIIISSLNIWAIKDYLYFFYWWFDLLLHFLGGVWVAVSFLWLYFYSNILGKPSLERRRIFLATIVAFLVVAVGWEIFEIAIGQILEDPNYVFDTVTDIIIGGLGAFVAYIYFVFNFLNRAWQKN